MFARIDEDASQGCATPSLQSRRSPLQWATLLSFGATIGFATEVGADCIQCGCNDRLYGASGLATCQNECKVGLGCFTNICAPAGLPGKDPTAEQDKWQLERFPGLSCYTVTEQPNDHYNCISRTVGVTDRWVWREVDGYGDRDGEVSIADFDAFYAYGGYKVANNCLREAGKEKVALYYEATGTSAKGSLLFTPRHAAKQYTGAGSKIGDTLYESN
jgi:hypothetical protein